MLNVQIRDCEKDLLFPRNNEVKDLPVDLLIGGEVTRPPAANLQFLNNGRNTISFGDAPCSVCSVNEKLLQEARSLSSDF